MLVAALFVLPFMLGYHTVPIPSFYNESAAFILGLLALYPLFNWASWRSLNLPYFSLAILGLIPLMVYQYNVGLIPTRSQALTYALYVLWAVMLIFLGAYHKTVMALPEIIRRLAHTIVFGAWFNIFYLLLQVAQKAGIITPHPWLAGGYGAIAQANHLSSFSALGIASILFIHGGGQIPAGSSSLLRRIYISASLLVCLILLTISGSRSGWLYMMSMTILAFWFANKKTDAIGLAARQSAYILLFMLPLYALTQYLIAETAQAFFTTALQRFDEFGNPQAIGGVKMRFYMWQQSLQLFCQQPWLGYGMGQTRWLTFSTLDNALPQGMPGSYEHPHNLLIFTLTEIGLIGSLLVFMPLCCWLWTVIKQPHTYSQWWLISVLSVIGIHASLEYPLSYAYFLGLSAYLIGLTHHGRYRLSRLSSRCCAKLTTLLTSLGLCICVHTSYSYYQLDECVRGLMPGRLNAQQLSHYYATIAWLNQKSLLAAYSYPLFLLAIEYLPVDQAGKQAINDLSLKVLPMPKSAYLAPLYLLQQQLPQAAEQAMLRAIQSYPEEYTDRLKSVPSQWLPAYRALYEAAQRKLTHQQ